MIRLSHAPLCAVLAVCLASASSARADDKEFFEAKIRPVLVEKCYSCHSADKKQRGGLVLDTKQGVLTGGDTGPSIVAGKPGQSLLLKAIQYTDQDLKMPPSGKLPADVIADFEKWIAGGAYDPRDGSGEKSKSIDIAKGRAFWSFQPPKMPELPAVKNAAWAKTPIDRFILAAIEREGLTPVDAAGRRELIRRATFDLTGLPPTPDEVEAFVADQSPNAFAAVVDRLLASPRYGERWSRHWLDVARYAEDQAHTFGVKPNTQAFRYRDWVIAALNADMPFDRFVTMQIAADLVEMPEEERIKNLPALGYFGLGAQYYKNTDAAKAAADELDDRVDTLSRGFLGLTVSCARCHDHKFDPIPTVDYYSLAGIFKSCNIADVPLSPASVVKVYNEGQAKLKSADGAFKSFLKGEKTRVAEADAGNTARLLLAAWSFQAQQGEKKRSMNYFASAEKVPPEAIARWVKFLKNMPKMPVLESCRAQLTQTEPKMRDQAEAAAKEVQTKLEEALAARAKGKTSKDHNDLIKALIGDAGPLVPGDDELIKSLPEPKKSTYDQHTATIAAIKKEYPQAPPPMAHGLSEGTSANMKVFLRGNPAKLGDEAPRRFLQVLSPETASPFAKGSGRLELAAAIASKENPLTARVIVNRLWQRHFGRGIVGTPSNFGELGDRPTHPELLDYLAVRLMDSGWSLKAMHREIMLSSTYQLASSTLEQNNKDAGNRWLWKHDRSRLDIESWRDAMLSVAGTLDPAIGGPTFDLNNQNITRRTVYAKISRHDLNATLRLFDFPDANITSERRTETTVPQQQLFVLNSPFVVDTAKAFAARVQKEVADEPARVRRAFALAYGRPPREEELSFAVEYLSGTDAKEDMPNVRLTRWERLAQVMLAGNEFAFVD